MEAADTQNSRSALSHSSNITMRSHQEGDQILELFEASERGDVSALESLIDKNRQILNKLSLTPFAQTPLHISSSLGHFPFTKKLLGDKYGSELALERDYNQRTALHLASAKGYIHIVKELLKSNKEACLYYDEEERIPLHYAVMRGRKEVVEVLIKTEPNSWSYLDNEKNNVFHLCVLNNQFETLQLLVNLERKYDYTLANFNAVDHCGNTVFHLAMRLMQVKTIKYLLSIPEIKQVARLKNRLGFTAHEILELSPKFFKTLEIRHMLKSAGIDAEGIEPIPPLSTEIRIARAENSQVESLPQPPSSTTTQEKASRKILGIMAHIFKEEDSKWLMEMRGNLSVVAAMISTITFQALINPPGGFVQQGINKETLECLSLDDGSLACPGDAMSGVTLTDYFHKYLKYNTISFIGSLSVMLLLVSGAVPLKHKAVIWILSIGMCITLTFLSLAYLEGLYMVTPDGDLFRSARKMVEVSLWSWVGFLILVASFITLRSLYWLGKKTMKKEQTYDRLTLFR